jgi:hypothetical protein
MDKVRKPNISVCYTPSSEPYSIYHFVQYCIKLKLHLDFLARTQAEIVGASKP